MNLTDAQVEELVRRVLEDTGLTQAKLGAIIEGMASTYGIREKYARDHTPEGNGAYDKWDFYLAGGYEILMNAGARSQHIEDLVTETYWRREEAKTNA